MKFLKVYVEMGMRNLKQFFGMAILSVLTCNANAQLTADKTTLTNGAKATVSVSFTSPVKGDLYLAVSINGELYFFGNQGAKFSKTVIPYLKNTQFTDNLNVLEVASTGVPAGVYTLYQVVTYVDKDPTDFKNWIGGLDALSSLKFSINQAVTGATMPPPVPEPTVKPSVTPKPTPAPIPNGSDTDCNKLETKSVQFVAKREGKNSDEGQDSDEDNESCTSNSGTASLAVAGKDKYAVKCSNCHGNPKYSLYNVLKGKDYYDIRSAINRNKGGMGVALKGITDAELKAIASYLQTF